MVGGFESNDVTARHHQKLQQYEDFFLHFYRQASEHSSMYSLHLEIEKFFRFVEQTKSAVLYSSFFDNNENDCIRDISSACNKYCAR